MRDHATVTECELCNAALDFHNVTRQCAECKLIARNGRQTLHIRNEAPQR